MKWLALALLLAASPALAWSNQGHMITGAIAHDDLAAHDPALLPQIEAIMQGHPDWARFAAALTGLSGEVRSRRLLELVARWPDDARGTARDHPSWHYQLRLILSVSDPVPVDPALRAQRFGQAPQAYALALAILQDEFSPPADRAIALCWLVHLAGDIQQPLHAAQLASARFPRADLAGQAAIVRTGPTATPLPLHVYWDNVVGGDEDDAANVEAQRLRLAALWPRQRLPERTGRADAAAFAGWADESARLARRLAYDHARFEGGTSPASAVTLSREYQQQRDAVGARRVAASGYRIADALRLALGPPQ
ncbi:MAG: hypothetical protein CFE37_13720 [Alphaproteobacteria bacterium PA4]|nr:MAG: hypothetical protein CFE37_13720 [Alphaproteobacteria bacterium PA4]